MRLITWNVNGLRSLISKGFSDFFLEMDVDIFALQETKMQENQKDFGFYGYHEYWSDAIKKGYSGTLIYTKKEPLASTLGIQDGLYNDEGRIITLEYPDFYLVNVYVPNSKPELARLDYRMEFEQNFREYLQKLDQIKPVILCGDLNVAHQPIDLKNPKDNEKNPGYSLEERTAFSSLLASGFVDVFREKFPERIQYTWWSYLRNARKNNAGWRIDYFLVSKRFSPRVKHIEILDQIMGSDHCPVLLEITD